MKGQDRTAFQYALGFPYWNARCPRYTPENEIAMNLGNKFAPPLM